MFNYIPRVDFFGLNSVFWTLALEAQFYLLLPLIVWLVSRMTFGRSGLFRCAAVSFAFISLGVVGRFVERESAPSLYGSDARYVYRSVLSYLDLFGYGMTVTVLERAGIRLRSWRTLVAVTGATILYFVANNLNLHHGGVWVSSWDRTYAFAYPPLVGGAMALALWIALTPAIGRSPMLNNVLLRFVGKISYSLYLYHIGVQFILFKRVNIAPAISDFHLHGLVYGKLFLIPTLLFSTLMYYVAEKPCLDWIARRRRTTDP